MNLGRIWAVASNGFREVIRDRVLYLIGLFALLLILAMRLLPEVATITSDKMVIDFGLATIELLGAIVAVFVGTGLINKEIEKRTVLVLIAKPVSRTEFILGKHLGLSGVLGVLVLAMAVTYLLLLSLGRIDYPIGSILISNLFLFFELCLITAVALVFGVFTSSLLATMLSFGVYLMGNFSQDLVELGNLSKNSSIQAITEVLYLVLPDLSRLNLKNEAVYGILPSTINLLSNGVYALFYTTILLAIAILLFSRREF
ncbi:MAG: ABC transporter permease [Symploca sp. SIO2G7]|nr:ABC transporter permease [Symploca sp. SIO2G7]